MVADTKFDLVDRPGRVPGPRRCTCGTPTAAFGQLQNQAYGYLWPMGPFFGLGDAAAACPRWVVQRLWWALLLVRGASSGIVRLARALGSASPTSRAWSRLRVRAVARACSPRSARSRSRSGRCAARAVGAAAAGRGAQRGSPRRAAALSRARRRDGRRRQRGRDVRGAAARRGLAADPRARPAPAAPDGAGGRCSPLLATAVVAGPAVPARRATARRSSTSSRPPRSPPSRPRRSTSLRGTSRLGALRRPDLAGRATTCSPTGYLALNSGRAAAARAGRADAARRNPHRQFLVLSLLARACSW